MEAIISRLWVLEGMVQQLLARLLGVEKRAAALEQASSQAQTLLSSAFGGGAGIGAISPATAGAGGITAGGSATITLASGASVTCKNTFSFNVTASAHLMVGRDSSGNYWVLSSDGCS